MFCWCLVTHLCPLSHDSIDCSLPGSSIHRISQTRILEWVVISFSRRSSWPRDWICVSCIGRQILYNCPTWENVSHSVMSNCLWPMDCSPPASSVHRISQARILKWVVISFSRRSSWPRDWTHISCIGRWVLYHRATRKKPCGNTEEE